ncbi:hypothetical protein DFJ73DRAFT_432167 [Zopfochytrium polystomum]|nr:hypothetical protein DFJ73DRAFT_432167 [Zopfochytrium polystomum]
MGHPNQQQQRKFCGSAGQQPLTLTSPPPAGNNIVLLSPPLSPAPTTTTTTTDDDSAAAGSRIISTSASPPPPVGQTAQSGRSKGKSTATSPSRISRLPHLSHTSLPSLSSLHQIPADQPHRRWPINLSGIVLQDPSADPLSQPACIQFQSENEQYSHNLSNCRSSLEAPTVRSRELEIRLEQAEIVSKTDRMLRSQAEDELRGLRERLEREQTLRLQSIRELQQHKESTERERARMSTELRNRSLELRDRENKLVLSEELRAHEAKLFKLKLQEMEEYYKNALDTLETEDARLKRELESFRRKEETLKLQLLESRRANTAIHVKRKMPVSDGALADGSQRTDQDDNHCSRSTCVWKSKCDELEVALNRSEVAKMALSTELDELRTTSQSNEGSLRRIIDSLGKNQAEIVSDGTNERLARINAERDIRFLKKNLQPSDRKSMQKDDSGIRAEILAIQTALSLQDKEIAELHRSLSTFRQSEPTTGAARVGTSGSSSPVSGTPAPDATRKAKQVRYADVEMEPLSNDREASTVNRTQPPVSTKKAPAVPTLQRFLAPLMTRAHSQRAERPFVSADPNSSSLMPGLTRSMSGSNYGSEHSTTQLAPKSSFSETEPPGPVSPIESDIGDHGVASAPQSFLRIPGHSRRNRLATARIPSRDYVKIIAKQVSQLEDQASLERKRIAELQEKILQIERENDTAQIETPPRNAGANVGARRIASFWPRQKHTTVPSPPSSP